jgi:endonuclease/exonuclease/phosphatase family metal-dependent hydrolase
MCVVKLASQMVPRWAPPSPRPSTVCGTAHHGQGRFEIIVGVVQEREIQHRPAIVLEHEVVGERLWCHAGAAGTGADALLRRLLVVRRIAEQEHLVEILQHGLHERMLGIGLLREQPLPEPWIAQARDLLRQRQRRDLRPIGGVRHEGVERRVQAEHEPHGPAGDLPAHAADRAGRSPRPRRAGASSPVRCRLGLGQRDGQRSTGLPDQPFQQRQLPLRVLEVRHELQHALPRSPECPGDAQELVLRRRERRRRLTLTGAMVEGARRGESQRAGLDGFPSEVRHGVDLGGRGRVPIGAALAHDVDAQRAVRHLGSEIDVVRPRFERVEELREGLPIPGQAFREHHPGNVLDPFHELHEPVVVVGPAGREAHAAVAHDRRRDPVPGGRREPRVPGGLAVVVRMDVDEARRDQQAAGVDLLSSGRVHRADCDDHAVGDGDVGHARRSAAAVDHRTAAKYQIVGCRHHRLPSFTPCAGSLKSPASRRQPAAFDPPGAARQTRRSIRTLRANAHAIEAARSRPRPTVYRRPNRRRGPLRMMRLLRVWRWRVLAIVLTGLLAGTIYLGAERAPLAAASGTTFTPPRNGVLAVKPATAPPTLRLATFNIQSGKGFDGVRDLERTRDSLDSGFDLIGLQEVRAFGWGGDNQAARLAQDLGMAWLFAPAERRWFRDDFGNAALAAVPVAAWSRTPLPGPTGHSFRNLLQVDLPLADTRVRVFMTHLTTGRRQDHALQFDIAAQRFLTAPAPAVLMGDLNEPLDSPRIAALLARPDVQAALPDYEPAAAPRRDWLLVRGLEVVEAGVIDAGASDHPCLWARLRLPAVVEAPAPRGAPASPPSPGDRSVEPALQ